jgi:hypothetical protein
VHKVYGEIDPNLAFVEDAEKYQKQITAIVAFNPSKCLVTPLESYQVDIIFLHKLLP